MSILAYVQYRSKRLTATMVSQEKKCLVCVVTPENRDDMDRFLQVLEALSQKEPSKLTQRDARSPWS